MYICIYICIFMIKATWSSTLRNGGREVFVGGREQHLVQAENSVFISLLIKVFIYLYIDEGRYLPIYKHLYIVDVHRNIDIHRISL